MNSSRRQPQALQRERRPGKRLESEGQEDYLVIVSRNPVCAQGAAFPAAMHHRPLAIVLHPHRDGLHGGSAGGAPVAILEVDVQAPQAVGAMISLVRPGGRDQNELAAIDAMERLVGRLGGRALESRQGSIPPREIYKPPRNTRVRVPRERGTAAHESAEIPRRTARRNRPLSFSHWNGSITSASSLKRSRTFPPQCSQELTFRPPILEICCDRMIRTRGSVNSPVDAGAALSTVRPARGPLDQAWSIFCQSDLAAAWAAA
jgi:hypothetical protein